MNPDVDAGQVVVELLETLVRKMERKDEERTRLLALMGDYQAKATVSEWDAEDGMEDVPLYRPDGGSIETVAELAAVMGVSKRVAAMWVLEHPGDYDELKLEANNLLADIASDHNNVFIALLPSSDYPGLSSGVEADELHMTLFISNELEGPQDYGVMLASVFEVPFKQISATASGHVVFPQSEDGAVGRSALVELVTSPDIEDLRTAVINSLAKLGIRRDRTYGYIPHITLGYVPTGSGLPKLERLSENPDIVFDRMKITAPGFEEIVELPTDVSPSPESLEVKPTTLVEGE